MLLSVNSREPGSAQRPPYVTLFREWIKEAWPRFRKCVPFGQFDSRLDRALIAPVIEGFLQHLPDLVSASPVLWPLFPHNKSYIINFPFLSSQCSGLPTRHWGCLTPYLYTLFLLTHGLAFLSSWDYWTYVLLSFVFIFFNVILFSLHTVPWFLNISWHNYSLLGYYHQIWLYLYINWPL